jgi:hypothetical protein
MCSLQVYSSSKSIDSVKVMNESWYFVMSSCLLAGQVPCLSMHCFRTSLCVCNIVQWFSRWYVVWSPCPQMHVASSLSLKRWRYALVLPCPVSNLPIFLSNLPGQSVHVHVGNDKQIKHIIHSSHWHV